MNLSGKIPAVTGNDGALGDLGIVVEAALPARGLV
jgi:hypothetical protein